METLIYVVIQMNVPLVIERYRHIGTSFYWVKSVESYDCNNVDILETGISGRLLRYLFLRKFILPA